MPVPPTTAPENHLFNELARVVEALPDTAAFGARMVAIEPCWRRHDATIEITAGGHQYHYRVEARLRVDRAEVLPQLKTQLETLGGQALLFTPYMTPNLVDRCRELDLQFLDAAGNAYLRAQGLYVFIKGQKPAIGTPMTADTQGGGTPTALRVVFALLNNRQLLNAPYREIAKGAHIALGAVGRVFDDLEVRGYVAGGTKNQPRRLLEPARLFDEWATNYPIRLRPKLNPRRFHAQTDDWWKHAHLQDGKGWWGGEVAADKLTNYLKAATCMIYLDPAMRGEALNQLVRENRLRADLNGNIEVLDAFWKWPLDPTRPDIVPPMLVYADLMATLNPRNLEVAKLVRERFIDDALRTP